MICVVARGHVVCGGRMVVADRVMQVASATSVNEVTYSATMQVRWWWR